MAGNGKSFASPPSGVSSAPLAPRTRTTSLNMSFQSEEGWRRRGGEAGDGVEASVKGCSMRERERERQGAGGGEALECYSVKVTQRRGGPARAPLCLCVFNGENSPQGQAGRLIALVWDVGLTGEE